MIDFIAKIKQKLKKENNVDATYLSITGAFQTGVQIGNSFVFIDSSKGNQYALRIFAPADVPIKRLTSDGNIREKNKQ